MSWECPECDTENNNEMIQCICGYRMDDESSLPTTEISKGTSENKEDTGFFAPERKGIDNGVIGGIFMIVIALLWFIGGCAAGYIFYYPPILGLIGIYAVSKGLATDNLSGEKNATSSYTNDHSINESQNK